MARKTEFVNFRVEVYPKSPTFRPLTDAECKARCEDVLDQVKRHVDHDEALVLWNVEETCSLCGALWTEGKDDKHNGGCCDADCDVMDAVDKAKESS